MVDIRDRRLTESTYPVLHIAPSVMRLKSIFARDVCDVGASTSRENWEIIMIGGALTGKRVVFSLTAHVLYCAPPSQIVYDSTVRVEQTRLISVRIRTFGLHAGSNSSELHWLFHVLNSSALSVLRGPANKTAFLVSGKFLRYLLARASGACCEASVGLTCVWWACTPRHRFVRVRFAGLDCLGNDLVSTTSSR